jgi:DNA (cytosine-5)-methyltransferase 1
MGFTFGSVCSGIEAASVAWHPLGWRAAWLAEIEPFPSALLAHHYPEVPNLGDMTQLPEQIVMGQVPAPDLLCGGTPCQAFSVAGLRQSLDDARGNLSLTFCEIANAIDLSRAHDGQQPCIVFWENVPGVLNTKDNAFGCFLAGLAGEDDALVPAGDKWPNAGAVFGPQRAVAWRVLDAQYFGVAQRRRRVFVVASARDDIDPAAILFEFEGVRRDSAPSRGARETAPTIPSRSTAGGGLGTDFDCDGGLIAGTLLKGGHSNNPLDETLVAHTLTSNGDAHSGYRDEKGLIAFHHNAQVDQMNFDPNTSAPLTCSQQAAVAWSIMPMNSGKDYKARETDIAQPIMAGGPVGGNQGGDFITQSAMQVRRLTPRECERLQGFPDDYTLVPNRGKPAADGPRYKALGNSWAVPNVRWIGWRIASQVFGDLA